MYFPLEFSYRSLRRFAPTTATFPFFLQLIGLYNTYNSGGLTRETLTDSDNCGLIFKETIVLIVEFESESPIAASQRPLLPGKAQAEFV